MSEFDLVSKDHPSESSLLEVTSNPVEGGKSLSALSLSAGPNNWSEKLTDSEIPGWTKLSGIDSSQVTWDSESGELKWQGRTFLTGSPPTLAATSVDKLAGFLARPDDKLPAGQNQILEWSWTLKENTNLYGCGQRSGPMERTGLTATNWTTDSPLGHNRTTDPLYQAHPLLWGVSGDCWWAILCCHTGYSRFDLGQEQPGILKISTLGPGLQLQIHAQDSPKNLYRSLGQVLQAPSYPPLWALGFHQSRWGYKTAGEVSELISEFRQRELPLDVVHLDIDHMDSYRSFTFHGTRFPQPKELIKSWKEQGVHTVTIIDPGLKFDASGEYGPIQRGLAGNHFVKSTSGAPQVGFCWPDEALFPDFCKKSTADWWAAECQFYLEHGVDGLWIDMNEPAIFDKPFWSGESKQLPMPLNTPWGESDKTLDHCRLRNVYGSFMSQATKCAWEKKQRRPWVLTRSGFTGVGQSAWSWMGDNTSWWEHLALSLPQLGSMGLVHSGLVGVDIGGFFGHCSGELYSAWIEASVIYPFMRAHSALDTNEQHPWSFGPEVESVAKKALDLRYRLLPYLYQAIVDHCNGGNPPLRPMFFDYPDDQRFRYLEDQMMLGPHLVACPFVNRGQDQRMVQLPEGEWYDFHNARKVENPRAFVIDRRPGLVPLFVRSGAVVPTFCDELQSTSECHRSTFTWLHFPGSSPVESKFYWDSGDGWDCNDGHIVELKIRTQDKVLTVEGICHGDYLLRSLEVHQAGSDGWKVLFEGSIGDYIN